MSRKLVLIGLCLITFWGCSKSKPEDRTPAQAPEVQEDSISNFPLKNCRFQNENPNYTFKSTIAANPIICDEGVATKVELLTPSPLPSGMTFSKNSLSLIGIANEKVRNAPYKFYIENEAGYAILNLKITVQ